MANSDYVKRNTAFGFCPVAILGASIGHANSTLTLAAYNTSIPGGITVGSAALIDDEIVVVTSVAGEVMGIGRGCCDTIPAQHSAGARIWFFDSSIGNDGVEYGATEAIGVKVLSKTGRSEVAVENSHPKGITFNWRFFRPYPPGAVTVNGQPWFNVIALLSSNLVLAWKHRDRIGQLDQLIDHAQDNIGPEPGTTYEALVYKENGTLVRTQSGMTGNSWTYDWGLMTTDFAVSVGTHAGYIIFHSKRDTLTSYQSYRIDFTFKAGVFKDMTGAYGVASAVTKDLSGSYTVG